MKRLLLWIAAATTLLAAVVVLRAATLRSLQVAVEAAPTLGFDREAAVERFAAALRFKTVSDPDVAKVDVEQFRALRRYFEVQFPLVHQRLRLEVIGGHSLVYTWQGTDAALKPVVLLSHQDVVPVEPGTEGKWTQPPWEGRIADGFVWGRGALDDKFAVVALLQAAEILLGEGFQPRRTFILAFGHDEEVGGYGGASHVAQQLKERGVQAEFVLDEGGVLATGAIPGIAPRVALIGTAEKGGVSLSLQVEGEGGHSSTPPEHTAVGIVSAAVHNLESKQMPMSLRGPVRQMIDYLGPELPFAYRLALANLWLVQPVIERVAANQPALAASMRTTTAATLIQGGVKDNVLPSSARAVVNFRILPGDTVESVREHVQRVVNDARVKIEVAEGTVGREPSPQSPVDTEAFRQLNRAIREVFPDVLVAPFLVLGGTDARHYALITPNVYRFTPILADASDLKRMHGTNERMSVENYILAVQFFARLYRDAGN